MIQGFEILTKLSSGGMGDVLFARRHGAHGFEKLLAVKTIRGDLARRTDIRAMFLDEARLVARLDHPSIAQVYDFGEEGGSLFLAMEYVPGIALNKLLVKRQRALPPVVAARIIAEACRGLHAAHELTDLEGTSLGVVHRDVSPGNVILTFDGHVKILDFGIAFMAERESPDTQIGELKGKPSYMAPEQLRGERVDRRTDIYSAGVVFHEMLTGRKLFSKQNVVATALAVERGDAPAPSTIVGDLPDGIDEIAMRALERHAHNRFPDAKAMALALDEVINREQGNSLEQFIDAELDEERVAHREWLHEVLSGAYTEPGTYERYAEEKSRSSLVPPSPQSYAPADAHRSSREIDARPLVDSTTLIPQRNEEAPAVSPPRSGIASPSTVAVGIFFLALLAFFGVRLLGTTNSIAPIEPIAPLSEVEAPYSGSIADEEPSALPSTAEQIELPEGDSPANDQDPTVDVADQDSDTPKFSKRTRRRRRRSPSPPTEKAVRPAPPTAFGHITVGAKPYALVRINGREVGVTPIVRKRLPVGRYEIQLVGPDTGEVRLSKSIVLDESAHERIMAQ